jgi:hypothetical protein
VQDAGDGAGAGRQGRAAGQEVADLLAAPGRVGLLEHEDGAPGQLGQAAAGRPAAGSIQQSARTLAGKLPLPLVERVFGQADQRGKVGGRQAAALPGIQEQEPLLRGQGRRRLARLDQPSAAAPSRTACQAERCGQIAQVPGRHVARCRRGSVHALGCFDVWRGAFLAAGVFPRGLRRAFPRLPACGARRLVGTRPQELQHTSSLSADGVRILGGGNSATGLSG